MADTGWKNPAGITIDTSYGTHNWLDPDNAKISDDARARAIGGAPGGITYYLRGWDFSMGVPDGATIDGIYVRFEKRSGVSGVKDARVRIIKAGVIGATDRSNVNWWPTTDAFVYHGSSSDKWGETWTSAEINHAWFGVTISAEISPGNFRAYIDVMQIKVYYTEVVGINMNLKVSVWKDTEALKIKASGAWKPGVKALQKIGGVWKLIFG